MTYPGEDKPIKFITKDGDIFAGTFIKEENMFYIGFGDQGQFYFSWQIVHWEYINLKWKEHLKED